MRILYVWDAEYPWDVRTEKVCLALTQNGHNVVITARNLQGRARTEVRPEGLVERLPAFPGAFRRWLSFPAFFNPLWLSHVRRLGQRHQIDLIVVRDLPLALTALLAAGKRWPVVLDMAENYPAMIADIWADGRQRRFDAIVRNPRMVAAVERYAVRHAVHVMTVVEESKERVVRLGVPAARVSVVSNTPPKSRVTLPAPRALGSPLRIVYLGLMEQHRGVVEVLDAARALCDQDVAFQLDLVGDGRDFEDFRAVSSRLGLDPGQVVFHGRLSHDDALAVVHRAHVGLVPHRATPSWDSTIPNKLFDYMAAGLAVVTSDAFPAARIVRETGAGLVFNSGNGQDLAEKLRQLLDLPAWERFRKAGQEAVRTRYNWEFDTRTLLHVVARVGSVRLTRGGD